MSTNLPAKNLNDSAAKTRLYFDNYGKKPYEFRAVDVDATISFFTKRGFSDEAAVTSSNVLLRQAKLENVSINTILDQLKSFEQTEMSQLVAEILNNNRPATSTLGFRQTIESVSKQRNVVP